MAVHIKRIYGAILKDDGYRVFGRLALAMKKKRDELFDTEPLAHLRDLLKKHNMLRWLYSVKEQHNHAIVIWVFLQVTNDSGTINTKGLNSNY